MVTAEKMKIYRPSLKKMLPYLTVGVLVGVCGLLFTSSILLSLFVLLFFVLGQYVIRQQEIQLSDTEATYLAFGKPKSRLKWEEVVQATVSSNPDFPWSFEFFSMRPESVKRRIFAVYTFFDDPQAFLKDVLSHLPPTCDINPNLIGLANEWDKHKRKVFLRTDWVSIKQSFFIVVLPLLALLILWLVLK